MAVTGGRDYARRDLVFQAFNALHALEPIVRVVSGACARRGEYELRGADRYAIEWAIWRQIDFNGRPARWIVDGHPQAGPMRNERMMRDEGVSVVLFFPGGGGTANAMRFARQYKAVLLDGEHPESWGLE